MKIEHPIVDAAKEIHSQLQARRLDGRDLDASGRKLRFGNPLQGIGFCIKTSLMAALLPAFLLSLSPQLVLGRFLGDRTDEGVDARTTYQFLAAMFGSIILWPFMAFIGAGILWLNSNDISAITSIDVRTMLGNEAMHQFGSFLLLYVSMIPLFWASGRMFGLWWDGYVDARRAFARVFASGTYKQTLEVKLKNLKGELQTSQER